MLEVADAATVENDFTDRDIGGLHGFDRRWEDCQEDKGQKSSEDQGRQ